MEVPWRRGVRWLTTLFNKTFLRAKMPEKWRLGEWMKDLEDKGLRVSREKNEYLRCNFNRKESDRNEEEEICIGDQILEPKESFRYLGSVMNKSRRIEDDVTHHIQRRPRSTLVRRVESLTVDGARRRGRPKLRWEDRLKTNLKEMLLSEDMTSDRIEWRTRIRHRSFLPSRSVLPIGAFICFSSFFCCIVFSVMLFGCFALSACFALPPICALLFFSFCAHSAFLLCDLDVLVYLSRPIFLLCASLYFALPLPSCRGVTVYIPPPTYLDSAGLANSWFWFVMNGEKRDGNKLGANPLKVNTRTSMNSAFVAGNCSCQSNGGSKTDVDSGMNGADWQHNGMHRPPSFASLLHEEYGQIKVNYRILETEQAEIADVLIHMSSVLEVHARFNHTLYGYPLGKKVDMLLLYVVEDEMDNYQTDGFSALTTRLGAPVMLDWCATTTCMRSLGRMYCTRALIDVRADRALKETMVISIPNPNGNGVTMHTIKVEYECKPPRCGTCLDFRDPLSSKKGTVGIHNLPKQHMAYQKKTTSTSVSNSFLALEANNGKHMDDLIDDTQKKMEAPHKKAPRKIGIWSGRKANSPKRNVVFSSETMVNYFDREDMDFDDM
nr:hypothetical protein [Tanacetum cinerariifolium]